MKSYRIFFSLVAAACLASVACIANFASEVAVVASNAAKDVFFKAFSLSVQSTEDKAAVVVAFVKAKEFVLRIIKRDRPLVSTNWTLAPSV